jgi:hypothetical protein
MNELALKTMKTRTLLIIGILLLLMLLIGGFFWLKQKRGTGFTFLDPASNAPAQSHESPVLQPKNEIDVQKPKQLNLVSLSAVFKKIIYTRRESLFNARLGDVMKDADRKWVLLLLRAHSVDQTVDAMSASDRERFLELVQKNTKLKPQHYAEVAVQAVQVIDENEWPVEGEEGFSHDRQVLVKQVQAILAQHSDVAIDTSPLERR